MNPGPRRATIRGVFFDAGMTLLMPARRPLEVYVSKAAELGIGLDRESFAARFKAAWTRLDKDFRRRSPDLATSDRIERQAWHDFTLGLAGAWPTLLERHADWHRRLVDHFDAPSSWEPAPGLGPLLAELRRRGLRLGVISNWHTALHAILEGLGLHGSFDIVLTSAEAGRKKPHADIFATALDRVGLAASEALHVGDSFEDDWNGAREAGLEALLLRSPEAPPVPEVTAIADLRAVLDHLDGAKDSGSFQ